jgi:hypothetical protein
VPGQALEGTVAEVTAAADAFARAGVDGLVIEPMANDLDDFMDLLWRFKSDVVPLLSLEGLGPDRRLCSGGQRRVHDPC